MQTDKFTALVRNAVMAAQNDVKSLPPRRGSSSRRRGMAVKMAMVLAVASIGVGLLACAVGYGIGTHA